MRVRSKLPVEPWLLGAILAAAAAPAFALSGVTTTGPGLGNAAGPAAGAGSLDFGGGIRGAQNDGDGINLSFDPGAGSQFVDVGVDPSFTDRAPSAATAGRAGTVDGVASRENPSNVAPHPDETTAGVRVVENPAPGPVFPFSAQEPREVESGGREAGAKDRVIQIEGKLKEGGGKVGEGKLNKLVDNADTVAPSPADATMQMAVSMGKEGDASRDLNFNMTVKTVHGIGSLDWGKGLKEKAGRSPKDAKIWAEARPKVAENAKQWIMGLGEREDSALDGIAKGNAVQRARAQENLEYVMRELGLANAILTSSPDKPYIEGYLSTKTDIGLGRLLAEARSPVDWGAVDVEKIKFRFRPLDDGRWRVSYLSQEPTFSQRVVTAAASIIKTISAVPGLAMTIPSSVLSFAVGRDRVGEEMAGRRTGATLANLDFLNLEWWSMTMRNLWPRVEHWLPRHFPRVALLLQRINLLAYNVLTFLIRSTQPTSDVQPSIIPVLVN